MEPSGRSVLLACPPGEGHDLGLRMVSDRFDMAGWATYFLGPDTPVAEIADAARRLGVDAVVSEFVHALPSSGRPARGRRAQEGAAGRGRLGRRAGVRGRCHGVAAAGSREPGRAAGGRPPAGGTDAAIDHLLRDAAQESSVLVFAARFLKSPARSVLIIAGIAVGIATQIFVGSLITSLQADLLDAAVGSSPHITLRPLMAGPSRRTSPTTLPPARTSSQPRCPARTLSAIYTNEGESVAASASQAARPPRSTPSTASPASSPRGGYQLDEADDSWERASPRSTGWAGRRVRRCCCPRRPSPPSP